MLENTEDKKIASTRELYEIISETAASNSRTITVKKCGKQNIANVYSHSPLIVFLKSPAAYSYLKTRECAAGLFKRSVIDLFEPFLYGELKFFSYLRIFTVFIHHPTTSLFVFFRNFAGIGRSRCQVIFIGREP